MGYSLRSMDEITGFDVYDQKWYHQTATGDVPASRVSFCISGAQETETGLYEIFVFGGTTGYDFGLSNVDSHQVYILTLPAFRWIRAANSSTASRAAQHCLAIGNRHMLSIGGYDPTVPNRSAVVDPWPYGLGIFDMTALQWADKYDAAAMPYVQSDQVKTYYSEGSKYPSSWNDPSLKAIFTNSTNTSATTPKIGAQTKHAAHQSSAKVIAGGVVGGIGGLTVLLVAAWLCFKRKYTRKTAPHHIDKQNTTAQLNNATTYGIKPELAVTTPARPMALPYGIKPELATITPAGLRSLPYGVKPELAATTPAGLRSLSNVEEDLTLSQP